MITEFPDDWSKSKQNKYRLLKPAFDEFRGAKTILLLQWLRAKEVHSCEVERPKALDHFKAVTVQHHREEALKMAQDADRAKALSLFSASAAPMGLRVN